MEKNELKVISTIFYVLTLALITCGFFTDRIAKMMVFGGPVSWYELANLDVTYLLAGSAVFLIVMIEGMMLALRKYT